MLCKRLTTKDNPYDPFDNFVQWNMFDVEKGYNTCCYLARMVKDDDSLTEMEREKLYEKAIDKIIELDPFEMYKKVEKEYKTP